MWKREIRRERVIRADTITVQTPAISVPRKITSELEGDNGERERGDKLVTNLSHAPHALQDDCCSTIPGVFAVKC